MWFKFRGADHFMAVDFGQLSGYWVEFELNGSGKAAIRLQMCLFLWPPLSQAPQPFVIKFMSCPKVVACR